MKKLQTIGLLGGTFDPIHLGHTSIAAHIAATCGLNKVFLIPNYQQPSSKTVIASATQRLEMVKLAVADQPALAACDIEIIRQGKSHTIDTLIAMRKKHPQASISFLLGEDAFHALDQWPRHEEFLSLCHLIIINRNSHNKLLSKNLEQLVEKHQSYSSEETQQLKYGKILLQHIEEIDINSTQIRQGINQKDILNHLSQPVYDYIKQQGLYKGNGDDSRHY